MRLLLDTHAFLWFIEGSPSLTAQAQELIRDGDNDILLSAASLWEMAIKTSLNKLQLSMPFDLLILSQLNVNKIGLLDISLQHIAGVARLPWHHRDPFDRMIVAQAIVEQLPVVSADASLDAYGIDRKW